VCGLLLWLVNPFSRGIVKNGDLGRPSNFHLERLPAPKMNDDIPVKVMVPQRFQECG
jgi:hypothetical protein